MAETPMLTREHTAGLIDSPPLGKPGIHYKLPQIFPHPHMKSGVPRLCNPFLQAGNQAAWRKNQVDQTGGKETPEPCRITSTQSVSISVQTKPCLPGHPSSPTFLLKPTTLSTTSPKKRRRQRNTQRRYILRKMFEKNSNGG